MTLAACVTGTLCCVCSQQLTKQKATADHAASILDKRFSTPDPRREPVVLLVDEVSHTLPFPLPVFVFSLNVTR